MSVFFFIYIIIEVEIVYWGFLVSKIMKNIMVGNVSELKFER